METPTLWLLPFAALLLSIAILPLAVGVQWELPAAVARRHQRHVFGFFPIPVRTREFCPDGGLGSQNRPFSCLIPGWMAQSAVVRDYRALETRLRGLFL